MTFQHKSTQNSSTTRVHRDAPRLHLSLSGCFLQFLSTCSLVFPKNGTTTNLVSSFFLFPCVAWFVLPGNLAAGLCARLSETRVFGVPCTLRSNWNDYDTLTQRLRFMLCPGLYFSFWLCYVLQFRTAFSITSQSGFRRIFRSSGLLAVEQSFDNQIVSFIPPRLIFYRLLSTPARR